MFKILWFNLACFVGPEIVNHDLIWYIGHVIASASYVIFWWLFFSFWQCTIAVLGYGPEEKSPVLALTYNYGVTKYDLGDAYAQVDRSSSLFLLFILFESLKVVSITPIMILNLIFCIKELVESSNEIFC